MKWRKLLWGGLSGLALGVVAVVARKRQSRRRAESPVAIPENIRILTIETEQLDLTYRGRPYHSRTVYTCNPTRFFVWSIFQGRDSGQEPEPSLRIFHVEPVVEFQSTDGEDLQKLAEESFYATLHLRGQEQGPSLAEQLARGAYLEFKKCHVGGSMNGVLTGDKILTTSPVAHFEFQADS